MGQTTPAVELGLHFHVSHTPVEFRDCILYSNEAFILTNGCLPFVKGEVFLFQHDRQTRAEKGASDTHHQ